MLKRVSPVCSGIQDIWVGHLDLECLHHDLDCHTRKLGSETKTISIKIRLGFISYPEIPKEKVDQSILLWFTCGCQDDWNRKRFMQIDKNDTENLVGMDTETKTSFYANK